MYQVTKRDGKIAEFNLVKISEAIRKAFEAQEKQYNQDIIDMLELKVTADFEPKIKDGLIAVEEIQDKMGIRDSQKAVTDTNRCLVCGRCVDACDLNLRDLAGKEYTAVSYTHLDVYKRQLISNGEASCLRCRRTDGGGYSLRT